MPKNISNKLLNHLKSPTHTLAVCWQIIRRDNQILAFTSHDQDLIIDGITYHANTGILPGAYTSDSKLSVNNLDLQGFLTTGAITETDIRGGLYDGAQVSVFIVNYEDPPTNLNGNDQIWIVRGYLGEIRNEGGNFFTAEIRGTTQILQQQIGDVISPVCRYQFGDSRCQVNLSTYTHTGSVAGVTLQFVEFQHGILSPAAPAAPYFSGGKVTFTSGQNNGLTFDVSMHLTGNIIKLLFPTPKPMTMGDTFTIVAGCAKTVAACKSFNNIINFGGEPYLPGNDAMLSGNFG